jgi:hypothetical protein
MQTDYLEEKVNRLQDEVANLQGDIENIIEFLNDDRIYVNEFTGRVVIKRNELD